MEPHFYRIYVDRPCWQCHWFGYLMAENPHGICVRPSNLAMIPMPAHGCAFWEREPGTDDDQVGRPPPLRPGEPARRAVDAERERLVEILALAEEEARRRKVLPYGFYVDVAQRTGTLGLTGGHRDHPADREKLRTAIDGLGVSAAIRAGRL
jgi:hypothetical protein